MNKKGFLIGIVLILIACFQVKTIEAQDTGEILRKMEDVMRGNSSYAEMSMKIVRPRYERDITLQSWAIGNDYSLILITAPARDRGTVFLMRENDIWNYDPRIDRTTRLPSSMMSQSWMGSDFTNDDLVRDSDVIEDYDHKLLRTEEFDGRNAYVLELIPKPDTPIVWGKVKMWVSTEDYLQLKIENYDQRFELVSTMILDEIREMDGRNVPTRITIQPVDKSNEKTVLKYLDLQFDIDIDESFFTRANMQRVRQ